MPRCANGVALRRRQRVELVLDRKFGVDDALAVARAREQLGQAVIVLRADDEIDRRRAAHDLLALGLRDAAGDRDQHLAALRARPLPSCTRMRPSSE